MSVFEAATLYHCPLNPAGMPFFLIIVHANQKYLTAVIFQAIQIVLSPDLFHYYTTAEGKSNFFTHKKLRIFPPLRTIRSFLMRFLL